MREVVKCMLRLQELELIKEEHRIIHNDTYPDKIAKIDANIGELLHSIPDKWRSRYQALRKNGLAVAREFGGVCQNCRMVISIGVLNRMRKGETDWICPNCGRFLLLSEIPDTTKQD